MFYAFVHKYEPYMRDTHGKRIGHVEVFSTKRTRDAFVDLNRECERISSDTARWHLVDELLAECPRLRDDVAYMTTQEIVIMVEKLRIENREG